MIIPVGIGEKVSCQHGQFLSHRLQLHIQQVKIVFQCPKARLHIPLCLVVHVPKQLVIIIVLFRPFKIRLISKIVSQRDQQYICLIELTFLSVLVIQLESSLSHISFINLLRRIAPRTRGRTIKKAPK